MLHTITADNGKESARHKEIAEKLGVQFYFARPYHSWERGANENTNGVTHLDLIEFGVMYNALPSPVMGSQFSKGQVERIKQQVYGKREFIIKVFYKDSNGQSQIFQRMGNSKLWRFSVVKTN